MGEIILIWFLKMVILCRSQIIRTGLSGWMWHSASKGIWTSISFGILNRAGSSWTEQEVSEQGRKFLNRAGSFGQGRKFMKGQEVSKQDRKFLNRAGSFWTGQEVSEQGGKFLNTAGSLWTGQEVYKQSRKFLNRVGSFWTEQEVYEQGTKFMNRAGSFWIG
jgi:hypothetical protein